MKKFSLILLMFAFMAVLFVTFSRAQQPATDAKGKNDAKAAPAVPLPFWVSNLPTVTGNIEKSYDINRDGILQTSETKILLRDVQAEVMEKNSYNVADSALLKAYDKNKDGIISKFELDDIKKDLAYDNAPIESAAPSKKK